MDLWKVVKVEAKQVRVWVAEEDCSIRKAAAKGKMKLN
jgi:hypothetical protein